jgi:hypothetical protein
MDTFAALPPGGFALGQAAALISPFFLISKLQYTHMGVGKLTQNNGEYNHMGVTLYKQVNLLEEQLKTKKEN